MVMKRRWLFFVLVPVAYIALLWLLVRSEYGAEGATIHTIPQALWYSLVTITSVGYGDLYPVTAAGRVIAFVFLALSVGLLGLFVSFMLDTAERLKPFVKLRLLAGRDWYVFTGSSPDAAMLAGNLHRESPGTVVIFAGEDDGQEVPEQALFIRGTVSDILSRRNSFEGVHIFCMKENDAQNYLDAISLADTDIPICCQAKFVPSRAPGNVSFYYRVDCAARLFWQKHPVTQPQDTIVLIGFGEVGAAVLDRALEINILSIDQRICYHVFGDSADYRRNHTQLDRFLTLDSQSERGDSLIFHNGPWNAEPALLERAGRIVLCADTGLENLKALNTLRKFFLTRGSVYIYDCDVGGAAVSFGLAREMLTPSYVMREELSAIARFKHELYRQSTGGPIAPWEELDSLLRDLNVVAADHLSIKVRILLGADAPALPSDELEQKTLCLAAEAFHAADAETLDRLRRIEHERGSRFFYLNNWRYAPAGNDSARLNPMLKPYDELNEEDRRRHDQSWELINQLRKWREPHLP